MPMYTEVMTQVESTMTTSPPTALPSPTLPPHYIAQSGDSLPVVSARFGLEPDQITSLDPIPDHGYLNPGQVLLLPIQPQIGSSLQPIMPDSEVIYSPSATDFETANYLNMAGGFLSTHREYLRSSGWTSAADIIQRVALENSISPRILISLLEYESHSVFAQPPENVQLDHLLGNLDFRRKGLYLQLSWAASQLSAGYYGWRSGALMEIQGPDDIIVPLAPELNAGSVALVYYFAQRSRAEKLVTLLDREGGFPGLHASMFGDPWERAASVEPLLPAGLNQPTMQLPFETGKLWSYSSGPHPAWEKEGALAALDFAPATDQSGCVPSNAWVVAVADGLVVRSATGVVVQDLVSETGEPSDGREQTGWAVLYLHIESRDRVAPGTHLHKGEPIGHPSCEGGPANGTHVHIARKFNGEWILAGGPLPFTLEGWVAIAGGKPYEGTLVKDDLTLNAHPHGSFDTQLMRPEKGD
jgi:LysM repeat protein